MYVCNVKLSSGTIVLHFIYLLYISLSFGTNIIFRCIYTHV